MDVLDFQWEGRTDGKALPGDVDLQNVSWDGKEILWTRADHRSKLVLVKNVFE